MEYTGVHVKKEWRLRPLVQVGKNKKMFVESVLVLEGDNLSPVMLLHIDNWWTSEGRNEIYDLLYGGQTVQVEVDFTFLREVR